MDAISAGSDLVLKLQEWSRDFVNGVEDWLSSFSAGDWVLVALAGAAIYWIWASLWAMTRLGPIEIDPLEHDGGTEDGDGAVAVKELTSALRKNLNDNGLSPPPSVPAGTPRVDLISAVEASGVPQSAFIAKLLEVLPKPPRPPQYKVTGVLIGVEASSGPRQNGSDGISYAQGWPCGLTYWVRPSREGSACLGTVSNCRTHTDAVTAAAFEIYKHVSNDVIHAFPVWARWKKASALKAYLKGCEPCPPGHVDDAVDQLNKAIREEPFNALARLRLANLYEEYVPIEPGFDRARAQCRALRNYLDIARDWPELVEARYRASVTAGALATTYDGDGLTDTQKGYIRRQARLPVPEAGEDLSVQLRAFAARESKAVLQLLKAWYALLHDLRLRNQFESKGHERRVVKHTVGISKHCVQMRELCSSSDFWSRCEIRYRTAAVHAGHLFFGRGSLNWQAYYNAACFDALLLKHLRKQITLGPKRVSQRRLQDVKTMLQHFRKLIPVSPELANQRRSQKVRERAFNLLDKASKEAGDQLSPTWVRRDPDFEVFKRAPKPGDEPWAQLRNRTPEEPEPKEEQTLPPPPLVEKDPGPIPFPPRPWGDPMRRVIGWCYAALLISVVAGLLFALDDSTAWLIVGGALVAFSSWRAAWAYWEARLRCDDGLPSMP